MNSLVVLLVIRLPKGYFEQSVAVWDRLLFSLISAALIILLALLLLGLYLKYKENNHHE